MHTDGADTLLMVVVLVVLATVGIVVFAQMSRVARGVQPAERNSVACHEEPQDILDRRFAAGEIDEEEYLSRTALLGQFGQLRERS